MPFIVFEGGEGAGKDTHIALLQKKLDPERTVFTREPGGTEVGEKLRAMLLTTKMEPETELLLFLAARAELVRTVIRPALLRGKLVISNRFGLSTIAYQIYGRERLEYLPFLKSASAWVLGDLEPPYYILFDIPPEIGSQRVKERNDGMTRFDEETRMFHERVRHGYLTHLNDDGRGVLIDARAPINQIQTQILEQMKAWEGMSDLIIV